MSSEIIVKFSRESKGAELAARALAEGNPSDAALGSYVKAISSDLGIPLEVKRLGSGGNVILAIIQEELTDDVLKRFREIPAVQEAHTVPGRNASTSSVEVVFKENSREAEILAQATRKGVDSSTEVEAIARKLEQNCGVALTARVSSARHLMVTPNLQRLTVDVVTRLKKRSDVEYAQPNFIRRLTSGNSSVRLSQ